MNMQGAKIFIIGYGDIGKRVARLATAEQATVIAMVRGTGKVEPLQNSGIETVVGDLDQPETLRNLNTAGTLLFYFAPPPGGGILDTRMRNFCASIQAGAEPGKVVYISTSGVYGDCGSDTVTESTPVNPETARSKRRLDAETTLLEWGATKGVPVIILRVTGIYGPGRLPIQHLLAGQPVLRPEEAAYTNRIHAEDLARICIAAADKGDAGDIFNVSDGNAGTMTDYFNAVADLLGYPTPAQVTMEEARQVMSPLMLSYVTESRRMDNSKMLKKLGIKLLYPTLAEGLQASISAPD